MNYIKLTDYNDDTVIWVNIHKICAFYTEDEQTTIEIQTGSFLYVKESPAEIYHKIGLCGV